MGCGSFFGGNSCSWVLILIIILLACGGNTFGLNNGCGCNDARSGCGCNDGCGCGC